jgi:ferric iron reductase protein FhuF
MNMLSYHNTSFDLSLSNIELQIYHDEEHGHDGLNFKVLNQQEGSNSTVEQTSWRKEVIKEMFKSQVVPLLYMFTEVTNVRIKELWELLGLGLYYGHDKMLELVGATEEKERIEEDFEYITKELEPEIFQLKKNPLNITFTMVEASKEPGTLLRIKPSCCLYYETEGAKAKCYTCPRASKQEREDRGIQILESMKA